MASWAHPLHERVVPRGARIFLSAIDSMILLAETKFKGLGVMENCCDYWKNEK
jgi:hypothetical protein